MSHLFPSLISGLLGFAAGIFTTLSLLEKPVWRLMWQPRTDKVLDEEARRVHMILKRVIHLLPPIMVTTMAAASILLVVELFRTNLSGQFIAVAAVFFVQLTLIAVRLRKDIRGVDGVPSDGDIRVVRDGLGALALLHHRGLATTASTLLLYWSLTAT